MASAVYSEPPRESPFFPSRLHILGHQHECVRWQSLVWFGGTFGGMNGCYLFTFNHKGGAFIVSTLFY